MAITYYCYNNFYFNLLIYLIIGFLPGRCVYGGVTSEEDGRHTHTHTNEREKKGTFNQSKERDREGGSPNDTHTHTHILRET